MRVVCAVVLLLISAPAVAQEVPESPAPAPAKERDVSKHGAGPGVARVRASAGLTPEVIGASVALRAIDPVEVEAGVGALGWFARAGVAMRLTPGSDSRTQIELVPTIGYAKFWKIDTGFGNETVPRDVPHGLVGLGIVTWLGPHVGLEGRLNLGAAFAQDYRRDDGTVDEGGFFPIVSLAAGVAF